MTKRLAEICTDYIIGRNAAAESKYAVLVYGLEVLIATVVGVALIAIISIVFGQPLAWIFFLLSFVPLRRTAGGYHADSHRQCYLIFTTMFIVSILIERFCSVDNRGLLVGNALSMVIIYFLSPVSPENKPMKEPQRRHNRMLSVWIMICNILVALVVVIRRIEFQYMHIYFYGVLAASLSLVAVEIKRKMKRGEKRNERQNA